MKFQIITFGCKVNQYESESLRELLLAWGMDSAAKGERPDIIVFNSCAVTAEGERKFMQTFRRIKREFPEAVTVVMGCVPQAFPEKAENLDADIICGNRNINTVLDKIVTFNGVRSADIVPHTICEKYNTPPVGDMFERTRAYIKIEDGCDRFCSYCIIPYARGHVRSRSIDSISEETRRLAQKGFSEIVLTGINLSAFGTDTGDTLADAVTAVAAVPGIMRVRLGSLEPDHIGDGLLNSLKAQPKFCPQFHLSLQSACNTTLKRMNRHYTFEFYKELTDHIRAVFPGCSITTDIMVGFAGEDDLEFLESLKNAESVGFAKIHVFPYSVRPGTAAAKYPRQVEKRVKEFRARRMTEMAEKCRREFLISHKGGEYPVLFERGKNGFYEGYTPDYAKVKVKSDVNIQGKIFNVLITGIQDDLLLGNTVSSGESK